jgi:hypothetical protein
MVYRMDGSGIWIKLKEEARYFQAHSEAQPVVTSCSSLMVKPMVHSPPSRAEVD